VLGFEVLRLNALSLLWLVFPIAAYGQTTTVIQSTTTIVASYRAYGAIPRAAGSAGLASVARLFGIAGAAPLFYDVFSRD
jgi:hypothetical protein